MIPHAVRVFALGLFALLLPALTLAQFAAPAPSPVAGVGGVVRDGSGAAVPGALVRLVNESSQAALETASAADGAYRFEALPAGVYRLDVVLDGFEAAPQRLVVAAGQPLTVDVTLQPSRLSEAVTVTARRIEETVQEVPIPVSVVGNEILGSTGAFNVNTLKEIIPTVQFYSTNPRNSSISIRGLGAPFGLTNDGIEPGVGLYIDGVFYARPAAATLDFLDVERVEVLRGPQGTLFGKNTTAGAINVTTRKPTFSHNTDIELNYGNYEFLQAKASISGPITRTVAGRISFSGTSRDGLVFNTATQSKVNNLNNVGLRGQLLFAPSDKGAVTIAVDNTRQRPEGYTQVVAGVAPTLRAANRQFAAIAAELGYTVPSFNAFDRVTDVDTPLRSYQDMGGVSLNIERSIGGGQLTATTAWRYWNWNPSNDRDFIGLAVTPVSAAPSTQRQVTQEVRWAGAVARTLNVVLGGFVFRQGIDSNPSFRQEQGAAAARFLLAPSANAATPGLLDGYGFNQFLAFRNTSAAVFGQAEWQVTDRLRLLPGLRFNYDDKAVTFDQQVYGGLQTTNAALIALQRSILAPQQYATAVDDTNLSGNLTAALRVHDRVNAYATYATSFKSVGLNLNGVPTDAADQPVLSAAAVKPEDVRHFEFGIKTAPFRSAAVNLTVYDTEIRDFQTQVVNAGVGVLRGYLANAEKAGVRGAELDGSLRVSRSFSLFGAAAYSDARYISFKDAPPPLEETGGPQVKDVSGSPLPGISKWALSFGGEFARRAGLVHGSGDIFAAIDTSYRSSFSSSASYSKYLIVDGYALLNARVGFRWSDGWSLSLWSRNLLDHKYYELLTPVSGNSGLFVGQPADPRTIGVTLRIGLR